MKDISLAGIEARVEAIKPADVHISRGGNELYLLLDSFEGKILAYANDDSVNRIGRYDLLTPESFLSRLAKNPRNSTDETAVYIKRNFLEHGAKAQFNGVADGVIESQRDALREWKQSGPSVYKLIQKQDLTNSYLDSSRLYTPLDKLRLYSLSDF